MGGIIYLVKWSWKGMGQDFGYPGEEKQGEDGFYVAGAYAIEGMSLSEP